MRCLVFLTLWRYDCVFVPAKWEGLLVVYNRVPKCGSTTVRLLLHKLHKRNNFTLNESELFHDYNISVQKQVNELKKHSFLLLLSLLHQQSFRQTHWLYLSQRGIQSPIGVDMNSELQVAGDLLKWVSQKWVRLSDMFLLISVVKLLSKCHTGSDAPNTS